MWFDISYLLNILNNLICYNLICDVTLSFQYNKDNYHSYTYTCLYITNKSNKLWMQYKIVIVKKLMYIENFKYYYFYLWFLDITLFFNVIYF